MSLAPASMRLSPEQERVVRHRGAPLQVIACAGSGKTESISRRVAALLAEGIEPAGIVAFTFTERAAAELKERVVRRAEETMGRAFLDRLGPMFIGTIHGYCFRLLQDHVPRFGNYDVLDEHRHAGLLSREYQRLNLSSLGPRHWRPIRDFTRTTDVIANELIDAAALDGSDLGECYNSYLETLDRYHFLTYGLLISRAVAALEDAAIFERVHGPLRHLLVDEFQDINPAQARLIERLASRPVELCVVGDDDQSIYQWRGSDVRHIVQFGNRTPPPTTVPLTSNRRCPPGIVSAANAFARTIPGRLDKAMASTRQAGTNEIVAFSAATEEDEVEIVADTIRRLHEERGYHYSDIAVLYRSVRTSAPPLIDALRRRDIPVICAGRTGLFLQPEIALFGEICAWFVDGAWRDERFGESRPASLDRITAGLARFFPGRAEQDIKKYLEDWKAWHLRGIEPVNLVGDFYRLLYMLGAHEIDMATPQGAARFGAYARFSSLLADFEHVNRRGRYVEENGRRQFRGGRDRGIGYLRALANYLLHYARDAYEDFEGEGGTDLDAVDVLTVHQAKGLEWPVVFIPALVKGRFPSRMAGRSQDWLLPESVFPPEARVRYEGGDAEERRLFYVALTRARDAVFMSYFERKKNRFTPSPYLVDVAGKTIPCTSTPPLPDALTGPAQDEAPLQAIPFSDLAVFEECGHRYRLASVLGFQQPLVVELGYGKAIHHVLRRVAETARDSGVIPDAASLQVLVDDEFYLPFANAPAFDRMYQAANRLVHRYVDEYPTDLRRVWAVERPFELHVEDGIVTGRADVILDEEGGRIGSLAIVDYKVAEDPLREERHLRQLAVYTAAGRGEGLNVEAAYLHELRDGTRRRVDVGESASREAISTAGRSMAAIRGRRFDPRPEAPKCEKCDFKRICAHGTGSLDG